MTEAYKIEAGREAMEKEWNKLENPGEKDREPAWDTSAVESKRTVIERGRKLGIQYHFGSIKELCHIKNYEKGEQFWTYKGRIVFRGDLVKDETGNRQFLLNKVRQQVTWREMIFWTLLHASQDVVAKMQMQSQLSHKLP